MIKCVKFQKKVKNSSGCWKTKFQQKMMDTYMISYKKTKERNQFATINLKDLEDGENIEEI